MSVRAAVCSALVTLLAQPLAGQVDRCVFQLDQVGGQGVQVSSPEGINYFAGGGVRMSCRGLTVSMTSDSVAAYGGKVVRYLGHVRYRDSSVSMDAERGTYYKDGERWEARGTVHTENLENGSTLTGPSLDYLREIRGLRDTAELFAVSRPTITYATTDSLGRATEPYVIVADRVRMKGNDRVWAGGQVTIDRSDFAARSDSLRLDTGAGSDGTLLGEPVMRGIGADSFALTGRRIDLELHHDQLTYVTAKGEGHAVSADLDLKADTIGLDLEGGQLIQTLAWGDSLRPYALSSDYAIRADSLALDTPGQKLEESRAFGRAWVAGRLDSVTAERDWLSGDTVVAQFAVREAGGRTEVRRLEARKDAKSYYRVGDARRPGSRSINYSRGERIVVLMKQAGESGVERVEVRGQVDGVQLEPLKAPIDSSRADSAALRSRS